MSSLYKIKRSKRKGYYWFKTKNGITYRCLFTESNDSEYGIYGIQVNSQVLHFSLQRKQRYENNHIDPQINKTVGEFLHRFFVKYPDTIICYICENSDSKAHKRQIVFSEWFRKWNKDPKKVLIQSNLAHVIHISVIMLASNEERSKIENHFQTEIDKFKQSEKIANVDIVE